MDEIIKERLVYGGPNKHSSDAEYVSARIPVSWLRQANATCPSGAAVGLICWHMAKLRGEPFTIGAGVWRRFGVNRAVGLRTLKKLADNGLLVINQQPGRLARIRVCQTGR